MKMASNRFGVMFMLSILLAGCSFNDDEKVRVSTKALSEFGSKLKSTPELTKEQEALISSLAKNPVPVIKMIDEKAIATVGVNYDDGNLIVLESLTGSSAKPCGKVEIIENYDVKENKVEVPGNSECIKVINPNEALKSALGVDSTINGEVLKNGKRIPARFVVIVQALYQGSDCTTTTGNGTGSESCNPPRVKRGAK
ncbi:hypothetical protein [Methylomonas sp. UP202]|uniref:hypothetical protein n=1 Tax=Methylomonas sp. UP202 TaxID=3040943 RepID=UPI00247AC357|nr:hypothetical protein [Methylomonas sp. UP202]WGS88264.1 hypothetical protein QC632_10990 [Methylomonas sp. UP202]